MGCFAWLCRDLWTTNTTCGSISVSESGCLVMQPKIGGKLLLKHETVAKSESDSVARVRTCKSPPLRCHLCSNYNVAMETGLSETWERVTSLYFKSPIDTTQNASWTMHNTTYGIVIGLFKYFDVRMLEFDWFLNLDARVSISECLLP